MMSCAQLQDMQLGAVEPQYVVYRIDVYTGTALGAGTDANIFCTLGGDRLRSSGEFRLVTSLLHLNKFERAQVGSAICCNAGCSNICFIPAAFSAALAG